MRILIPTPDYEDSFADNVKRTLAEMGHEVFGPEPITSRAYGSIARRALVLIRERLLRDRPTTLDRQILALAKTVRPDILLSLTWDIHPAILDELGHICPGRRILWWGDPPANSRRWGIVNPGWDRVYIKDPDAVRKLLLAGKHVSLLHEAMNPSWHRVIAEQEHQGIVIAGNYYAYRQTVLMRLMRDGVRVVLYGPKPPRWSLPEVAEAWTGRYVTREEKSRAFGAGLGCLNTFTIAEGNSLNCRAFEIAGAGGLQMIEHRPIIEECFEPGKELLVFQSYEELLEHIRRARTHSEEMKRIRQAGARRALAHHTYRHRLAKILSELR